MNEAEKKRSSDISDIYCLKRKNVTNQFTPSQFLGSEIDRIKLLKFNA